MNWLKLSNKYIYYLTFFGLLAITCNAQNSLEEAKKIYPDFNELILNDNQSYDLSFENGKLKVIQDNYYESMILTENGIQNNKESFSYSELVKLKEYEAFTVINNNGKSQY